MVLAVARQEPQKGLDTLLQAVPALLRGQPAAQVVIAGPEGRASAALSRLVRELHVGSTVRFLGVREDVADLLCAADVFVLPSLREGLPGAVLEAMAMEVPVVASDLPTVREAVPGDEFAMLVPVANPEALGRALVTVLSDPAAAGRRVRSARARFDERFDISAVSRAMVRFYRAALAGRSA
jgi:glycosyltransferase involved in cell wall biosynthesis